MIGALAGQVASEMRLESPGLLTPGLRMLTQRVCGHDHEVILAIRANVPVAYLYGQAERPSA